ncbi:plexin-B1 [Synchiropus splendidus]|uniref:plexin-B1 n=1 Tax=Synchiropus splendidus TaxID=270530 RepID=UPI00237E612C|nr:plexin-B1 [Synchiropus splendidus]
MCQGVVCHIPLLMVQSMLSVLLLASSVALTLLSNQVVQGKDLSPPFRYPTFMQNITVFEHLALHPDPAVGRVYVGAQDHLFQLDQFLQLEVQEVVGPVKDSWECLPPVTDANCPQARITSNHNKLLVVDPYSKELITCGSVNQGTCQKRSLDSLAEVLFSAEKPVDTQYVAANHPNVSTVGLVVQSLPERHPVLFVGRGYTSSHPPITTRNLAQEPIFSYEESAKLAVAGRLSEYDHHFISSFSHRQHVYFLFYRRDLKSQSREYRSYISRVCVDDQAYYSYVEVPLTCHSKGGKSYNLLQAVHLGISKERVFSQGSEIILGVFSTQLTSSSRPSEDSALCMFYLNDVDQRINSTRDQCYTQMGRDSRMEAAYIEYEVKSNCANLPENTLDAYPCGSDHTPSPIASRIPVEAETLLDSPSAGLTAVAVSMRAQHAIAFLGDSKGHLHKVFLGPNGEVEEYAVIPIQRNGPISSDLILDKEEEHLFIMTPTVLQKIPVAECKQHQDCHSCLLDHDPYCGWCVLEGRCVSQSACSRGDQHRQWLWSFDMEQQCPTVHNLSPSNISRAERKTISLTVPGLPEIKTGDSYSCYFHNTHSPATVTAYGVTCQSPDTSQLPMVPTGQDFVTVTLSLRFGDVLVTAKDFTLYDCTAVKQLSGSMPCSACVSSRWGCNWCVHQHSCTHKPTCDDGVIIFNQHFKFPSADPTAKPKVHSFSSAVTSSPSSAHWTTLPIPTTVAPMIKTTVPLVPLTSKEPTPSFSATTQSAAPTSRVTATASTMVPVTFQLQDVPNKELSVEDAVDERESETKPPTMSPTETTKSLLNTADVPVMISTADSGFYVQEFIVEKTSPQTHETKGTIVVSDPFNPTSSYLSLPSPSVSEQLGLPSLPQQVPQTESLKHWTDESTVLMSKQEEDNPTDVNPPLSDVASSLEPVVLSGDGQVKNAQNDYPLLRNSDSELDYQYDPADMFVSGDEGSFVIWGSSACPCVEKVLGSSLIPVRAERKITLQARNLHLYQDEEMDYVCVLVIEDQTVVVDAYVEKADLNSSFYITCQLHKYTYSTPVEEYPATVYVKRRDTFHVDSAADLYVTLYNCSVSRSDCSRCYTADPKYSCVWCGGVKASCLFSDSCNEPVQETCPPPVIHFIEPLSGLLEGGTMVTILGSNLGQRVEDIFNSVSVAGVPCAVISGLYEVSSRIVCRTRASREEKVGRVSVKVSSGEYGLSAQTFSYQDPFVVGLSPERGPKAGGTFLTISGRNLLTGHPSDLRITVGGLPCTIVSDVLSASVQCLTTSSNKTGNHKVTLHYGGTQRHLHVSSYHYTQNPNITHAQPHRSFLDGGRLIYVSGNNLDVVQKPQMTVTVRRYRTKRSAELKLTKSPLESMCPGDPSCSLKMFMEECEVKSSSLILCRSPVVDSSVWGSTVTVEFLLDNLRFDFNSVNAHTFSYEPNPVLRPLNQQNLLKPYRYNPGSFIQLEGENLDLAITKEEVVVLVGKGVCAVKTLTRNHLYCEPPRVQPAAETNGKKREGLDNLPEFTVQMGNLNFSLGKVQYDNISLSTFPIEAQIGLVVGASIVALIVLIIVLIYRRKSKRALRDYKKVQIQLENLETSVRDRCKKEFTDLMTEMMDMSSDLVGSGIPFLDYRMYAERIFFPGHRVSPLRRGLEVQECRRQTVEQGLIQLSNLLNSKLFLIKFIHTLESQRTFSPRDRAYVASLLTVALHGKLEYFTDILKTLLSDLVEQYVAKNPKLMLRRTETVVEKLLTNWMSICLYAFLRDSAGESLYMLFRAIKHQVDKGPVDAVTGKAKYTLNDNRLLREDVDYKTLNLNVLVQGGPLNESHPLPAKVLDCDTITQVKEKLLDQVYKSISFSHRPHADSLDLEWRSGVAGHLVLSDEDLTSVVQGNWKRLNTLQHYKVPDGATVALVPRHSKHIHHDSHDYAAGEKTPMLEDADEGGVRLWHLVKASEEPELPKHRRGSLRERERAKAIPEIYLTRLLSVKGTLQNFVDDLFTVILSTSRPVPLAVKYFFDLLDEQAVHHGISDPETIHIWKTNSLPLRFWINVVKNPQFIFDVQMLDHVDAVLSVIAQTFMDSCTIAEHKLGRDSPINKLLYARDIPRYRQMVESYYADIRQTISASDQEMNSALAELSRNYSGELNYLVALHELYKYINKYYDQIITALEEDSTAQKMQLGYRLQQIAASVENKVTDL